MPTLDSEIQSGKLQHKDMYNPEIFVEVIENALQIPEKENPVATIRELSEKFEFCHSTIHPDIGKVTKLGQWVPHKFSSCNLVQKVRR